MEILPFSQHISKAAKQTFHDHIIVLVLAGPNDPPVGFQDFILPLRSSKIRYEYLKEIVFLGDPQFLEKEWSKIRNLPKLTVVKVRKKICRSGFTVISRLID